MNIRSTNDSRSCWKCYAAALALLAIVPCNPTVTRAEMPLGDRPTVVSPGSLIPVSHSISKTKFCVGEPVIAEMNSRSADRTDDRIHYVIGGVPGKVVALTFDKAGEHQVLFAASDGSAMNQELIAVQVEDCGNSFEYVTLRGVPLAFENDTFHYTAAIRFFGPVGSDNRSKRFLMAKEVAYEWDFGDGA